MLKPVSLHLLKPGVFILSLLPLALLVWWGFNRQLGANPVETITHHTGELGLRFLLITLAVTPLRRISGWRWPQRLRRMLGLFAFFYIVLHFTTYLVFDHYFDWRSITADIIKRPYITVGFAAFVLILPLAVTSTNAMMRRLGRRWQRLHRLIYPIAIFGVLHYLWLVKADFLEPLVYTAILALLLGFRLWYFIKHRSLSSAVQVKV